MTSRSFLKSICLCLPLFLFWRCGQTNQTDTPLYKDAKANIDERVDDLLARMTLREKTAQVLCLWQEKTVFLNEDGSFSPEKADSVFQYGLGQIGRPSEKRNAREMAEFTNEIQKYFLEKTRLGIPVIFHEECLHGHAAPDGTHYPQPIGMASTWDRELIQKIFTATAKEARLRGASQALTPVVDVARDPRWGRVEETYGEDPYLVSEMGLAAVRGFQGEGPGIDKEHVISTLKHFAAHGQPESGNNIAPVNISERTLRETFFYPFKKAVEQGGVMSIMASYNEIDGVPSHASDWLLNKVLREDWGFEGVVVSDYYAIKELFSRHHVAEDMTSAASLALKSGVDIELPDPEAFPDLEESITNGSLDIAYLDKAVRRILKHKFLAGLFDNPYVDPDLAEQVTGSDEHRALALKAAQKTITLLQNEGNLAPIDRSKVKTIAVIGPNANTELLGGYSDQPKQFVSVLQGIKERAGDNINILYAEGCKITEPGSWYEDPIEKSDPKEDRKKIREAVAVARKADVVVLAIGGNELTSREGWSETHLGDRTDLQMVGLQNELIDALAKTGKPIIAFLFNGKPLAINNVIEKVPTIFESWYLGQETGYAVADVLFGEVNPGGKLPISFPRSVGHIPAYYNYKPTARRGYLFDDVSPLFAFGYGLSYTTFDISAPTLSAGNMGIGESTEVSVTLTNTGDRAGDEVVQVYIRDKVSSVTRPVKELKEFRRVTLQPGESKEVSFNITPEMLSFYDINMNFVVEPGDFDIMVGSSSRDQDLKNTTLTVK